MYQVCFRRNLTGKRVELKGRPLLEKIKPFAPYEFHWRSPSKVQKVGNTMPPQHLGNEEGDGLVHSRVEEQLEVGTWLDAFKNTRILDLYLSCMAFLLTILALVLSYKTPKEMMRHLQWLYWAYVAVTIVPKGIQAAVKLDSFGVRLSMLPYCGAGS
jgi:hypothetical protein